LPQDVQYGVGAVLIAVAFVIASPAMMQFRKAKTNVDPYKPVTAIIKQRPFRWTRNPLYLAMAVLQLGIAAAVDGVWLALMAIPAIAVIRIGVIAREEHYLEQKFGEEYLSYKATVRRWG
jgi:protein-S-isoprenylcysteine O-methyltransferase Ste14